MKVELAFTVCGYVYVGLLIEFTFSSVHKQCEQDYVDKCGNTSESLLDSAKKLMFPCANLFNNTKLRFPRVQALPNMYPPNDSSHPSSQPTRLQDFPSLSTHCRSLSNKHS